MINKLFRLMVKIQFLMVRRFWTSVAYIKLRSMGRVGKNFIAEGPISLAAMKGTITVGDNVLFGSSLKIAVSENGYIEIGNNVSLNQGTFIICLDSIRIGDNTRVGEYCSIRDNDHGWKDINCLVREQGYVVSPVAIGEDVWIGRGGVVGKGVSISSKCVVGANSVVTKSIPFGEVWVGSPATKINERA